MRIPKARRSGTWSQITSPRAGRSHQLRAGMSGSWGAETIRTSSSLMSHVKLGGATTRLSTRFGEMSMRMIVQRWERSPETSVNILLFAGSRMSVFRLGLSRSEYGRRPRGRPHAVARDLSFTGPCPGAWLPENGLNVPSCSLCRALLPGRTAGRGDLAIDGPDEAGEFTGDRGDGDGLEFAAANQRPITLVQSALRLPGNLANRRWGGVNLVLLVRAHPRRMLIAPGAFHQHAAGTPVTGLGDRTAPDGVSGRILRRHQAEIGHQLVRRSKAREVADLGQQCRRRNKIDAAHRHQRRGDLGQRPLRHRAPDRILQACQALLGLPHRQHHLLENEALLRVLELLARQPVQMRL